jgi:hypothetical protein
MPPKVRRDAPGSSRRIAFWGMAVWLVLLFAALGGMQYLQRGAWAYLAAAFAVIVLCAGCALRQEWARRPMQAAAALLALWSLATLCLMVAQWSGFERAREAALAQPQGREIVLAAIEQARRGYLVGMALKAVAVPVLLWLAWQLGLPQVRAQFHGRPLRSR